MGAFFNSPKATIDKASSNRNTPIVNNHINIIGFSRRMVCYIGRLCIHLAYQKKTFRPIKILCFFAIAVLLLTGAYYYKQDSAKGRLLIWRISADMIADAPLMGHGIGAFEKKYMYYQARYFRENPESKFRTLADNIIYPYNELLHIGVELGGLGMLTGILLIIVIFKYGVQQKENIVYMGAFMSLLIFSMFSYPSHVILLLLLFPILLGGMACEKGLLLPCWVAHRYTWWGICVIVVCLFSKGWYEYNSLEIRCKKLYLNSHHPILHFNKHLNELKFISPFLDLYVQYSYQHLPVAESLPILQEAISIIPTSELLCDLGNLYLRKNELEKAIECYQLSSDMIPHRIIPKYKLFQLYRNVGDLVQMRKIGKELLATPVKKESMQTLQIKGEIKRVLQYIHLE